MRAWAAERRVEPGAIMSAAQCHALGAAFNGERLSPAWRRPTPEGMEPMFASLGLTGPFWRVR